MNLSEDDVCTLATVDLLSLANPDNGAHTALLAENVVERERVLSEQTMIPSSSSSSNRPASAIYQINFDVEHVGKNKPQSKRVAIWKYGMTSRRSHAPDQGGTASTTVVIADHEARLTWSTHSGKYMISVDGEEVSSAIARGSVLEHRWRWSHSKGRVVEGDENCDDDDVVAMRVVACRKPPVRSSKDFRCYEFVIGGRVFRDLPVYDFAGSCFRGSGHEFRNEESAYNNDGKLMSILDVIEPGWRDSGFA
ncbi:hypothetical protein ACHAXA_006995 [Cyclostephanos tholiformis]|jgi:hypothetical protein|uniref:Uncharacterized protein n=1 Tax=Cyclostephanos tholiformis TaxID=382380 RepID=A0ABD3R0S6_9STRA